MLKSRLCDYSDAYIPVRCTIRDTGSGANNAAKRLDKHSKGLIFRNCATFTI